MADQFKNNDLKAINPIKSVNTVTPSNANASVSENKPMKKDVSEKKERKPRSKNNALRLRKLKKTIEASSNEYQSIIKELASSSFEDTLKMLEQLNSDFNSIKNYSSLESYLKQHNLHSLLELSKQLNK